MKRNIFFTVLFLVFILFFTQGCELFVIKGQKIIIEEQAHYTQKTPLGVVTIFLNELANDNVLAASELLIKDDGRLLNASEKYEITSDLSRMKRFLDGKQITKQNSDTTAGVVNVVLELDYGKSKAKFITKEINSLYYILSYERE
jgi:hypothetical protein